MIVFAGVLVVYWMTLPREVTLEDAGLFQMTCHLGGIAHPPGYPLFTTLCIPFVNLSIWGAPSVLAGNLLSALFASIGVAVFHQICFKLLDDRPLSYIAAFAYGFSATYWSQAIIIEVYSLAAMMFMISWLILILFVETRNWRYWYLFCLCVGLALSNHWPLMMLSMPALIACAWSAMDELTGRLRSAGFWLLSLICFGLGLTPYLTLVIDQNPEIAMTGAPSSLEEFIGYIGRSIYSDNEEASGWWDRLQFAGWLIKESFLQTGVVGIPVILIGILASVRRLSPNLNVTLLLVWLGTTLLLNLLLNFAWDFDRLTIFKPYPVIAYAAVAFWFALGAGWILDALRSRPGAGHRPYLSGLVVTVAVGVVMLSNFTANDRHDDRLAARYGRAVLESMPADAIALLDGDHEVHVIGYLHLVEGLRPDIEVRQWMDLVFANRLGDPLDPEDEKIERIRRFVAAADRPVASPSDLVRPATDFALFSVFEAGRGEGYAITPRLLLFRDYVLELYRSGYLHEPNELMFADRWIMKFTEHHASWRRVDPGCPDDVCGAIESLAQTFPGKVGLLQASIDHVDDVTERSELVSLAQQAAAEIPPWIRAERLAHFYELYARALLIEPADPQRAAQMFRRSIDAYPATENRSICELKDLLDRTGQSSESLRRRFSGAGCLSAR